MNKLKININKNFLLPFLLTIVLSLLLLVPMFFVSDSLNLNIGACNFSGGGGGTNACENQMLESTLILSVITSNIIAYFINKKIDGERKYNMTLLLYLFLVVPLNLYFYDWIVSKFNISQGDELGNFNNSWLPIQIMINLIILLLLSIKIKWQK